MRMIQPGLILAILLAASVCAPLRAAEPDDPAERIEEHIEQARKQLDSAARRLAELHTKLWRLETTGPRSDRAMLGVLIDDSGGADGLTLQGVTPDGGASKAGLMAGDRLVAINGVRLDEGGPRKPLHALHEVMSQVQAGDAVSVTYVRDGEAREAEVETQARGRYMARIVQEKGPWLESLRSLRELEDLEALKGLESLEVLSQLDEKSLKTGVVRVPAGLRLERVAGPLAEYFQVAEGVLVLAAPEAAPELEPGDILQRIDGQAVTDPMAALRQLAGLEGSVAVQVLRQGRARELTLDADALNSEQAIQVNRGDRQVLIQRRRDGQQRTELRIIVDD